MSVSHGYKDISTSDTIFELQSDEVLSVQSGDFCGGNEPGDAQQMED